MINHNGRLGSDIERLVLQRIAQNPRPIGQVALSLFLQKQGFSVSTPTIGRRLQVLEHRGLVRKAGVDGRMITSRGLVALKRLDSEARLRDSGDALLRVLRQGDKERILDLLFARRVIERETAALAAERASASAVRKLESIIVKHQAEIDSGRLGLHFDIRFHLLIAKLSGNIVLYSLTSLLRSHEPYNIAVGSASAVLGTHSLAAHREILDAIKNRAPKSASIAMANHMDILMNDLQDYWRQRTHVVPEVRRGTTVKRLFE